ncbi:MAG: phage tail sheath subtilisin-like domain-containing protein [Crocosphaera sp.]|nr:phage tail sheath subtilisin-like domain-containing protein [Crocosphaera sp.]
MATTYKIPGVHIEELPATGPISGVGTSTVAFIGPAAEGPINVPTKITNWSQFKDNFGEYIPSPRHYMAYAVEGFFKNGGTVAYIVRVGTAARAFLELDDRATPSGKALRVEARQEGTAGNSINVQVQDAQIVRTAEAARAEATVSSAANNKITVTDASDAEDFKPGDVVTIETTTERVTIDRIRGADIFLTSTLSGTHSSGTLRIADLIPTQKTFRVDNGSGLEVGSVIEISQGTNQENKVIDKLAADFVTLNQGLTNTYTMASADAAVGIESFEFNLIIRGPSQPDETFTALSMDSRHSRYFSKIVNSVSVTVRLPDTPSVATPPNNRPAVLAATNLAGGTADNLSAISATHYQKGINALNLVDDVNVLCIPDRTDTTVQQAMITHCETMADRFAVLDPVRNAPPFGAGSIIDQRANLESQRGYAALYYPWLSIADPQGSNGQNILVPPSGHLVGIYARSDAQYGVHKAPANEMIAGALGLERKLTETELGEVNVEGINVIRTFPNRTRPTVWGARTTAPAAEAPWRYVNVRRLLLYIEESIEEGIRWAVFEPNNRALWKKLTRRISEFLTRVWRDGALFGATPEEAFYVKCDEELNPKAVRELGQVIVEVGVAPVRPAEFVIVRIGQWAGGSETTES